MERQSIPPAENKLLLLFIIIRMGAMDDQSLERFVLENGLMGYMEARLALAELLEAGLLQALDDQPPRVYLITGDGTKTLELFQTKLPYSRRSKVEELVRGPAAPSCAGKSKSWPSTGPTGRLHGAVVPVGREHAPAGYFPGPAGRGVGQKAV